jgi:outer membrane receptor protein involved in Fe transport
MYKNFSKWGRLGFSASSFMITALVDNSYAQSVPIPGAQAAATDVVGLRSDGTSAVPPSDNVVAQANVTTTSSGQPASGASGENQTQPVSTPEEQPAPPPEDQPVSTLEEQPASTLEEVTVTANKRAQSSRDVPSAVAVMGGSTLRKENASNFQDFAAYVPGLSSASSGVGENQVVIRGVNTGAAGSSSTVGIFVDETPIGSSSSFAHGSNSFDFNVFDLERLEVLSGPQGTLYGAGSLGGLLKYVTQAPDLSHIELLGETELDHTQSGALDYGERAAINLPLIKDKWALRADGILQNTSGFIDDPSRNLQDIDGSKTRGGRLSLLGQITPDLSLRITGMNQAIARDGSTVVDKSIVTHAPLYGRYDHESQFNEPFRQNLQLYSAVLNWNLGFGTLTSASSWQRLGSLFTSDESVLYDALFDGALEAGGLIPPGYNVPYQLSYAEVTQKFTQELRLSSAKSKYFDWQVGGYFTIEHSTDEADLIDQASPNGKLKPNVANIPIFYATIPSKYRETAIFADGTAHFTSRLDLTLGIRYAGNYQANQTQLTSAVINPTAPGFYTDEGGGSHDTVATFLINPSYRLTDTSIVYARVASGYRPGGPNFLAPGASPTFHSDSLVNYEIGEKTTFFEDRASLDINAYYINWSDIQLEYNKGGVNQLTNGAKARIRGEELTGAYKVTRSLTVGGNLNYTNAVLAGNGAPVIGATDGEPLPLVPRFSGAATADYRFPLWSSVYGTAGISNRFVGNRAVGFDGSSVPKYELHSYNLVDLRFGAHAENLDVSLYLKNVFNQLGELSADTSTQAYAAVDQTLESAPVRVGISQPRTVGVVATYSLDR